MQARADAGAGERAGRAARAFASQAFAARACARRAAHRIACATTGRRDIDPRETDRESAHAA
jgi:hypothetical protein